jgi:hypothetical protein
VTVWRKALGVPRANEGTCQLQSDWSPERFTDEIREHPRQASRSPERAAKIAAAKRGKPRPPLVIEAMRRANLGRKFSAEHLARLSKAQRARGEWPPAAGEPWNPAWDALLGTMFDKDLAAKLGVAAISVWRRRKALGIPSCRRGNRSNLS